MLMKWWVTAASNDNAYNSGLMDFDFIFKSLVTLTSFVDGKVDLPHSNTKNGEVPTTPQSCPPRLRTLGLVTKCH